jgi:hypothetical protein
VNVPPVSIAMRIEISRISCGALSKPHALSLDSLAYRESGFP